MTSELVPPQLNRSSRCTNKNIPRHNGRFIRFKPINGSSQAKTNKRRTYNARKDRLCNILYDKFLQSFIQNGTDSDWIPASQSTGPIVALAGELFRPSFLLTQTERSEKLRVRYAGGDPNLTVSNKSRVTTRDAQKQSGKRSRIRKYSSWRFPLMENYSEEVAPIKEFLKELQDHGALKPISVDAAFTLCLNTIKSYVTVNGKRAYIGYPKARSRTHDQSPGAGGTEDDVSAFQQQVQETNPESQGALPNVSAESVLENNGDRPQSVLEEIMPEVDAQCSDLRKQEEDLQAARMLFEMANHEDTYRVLCLLFDEDPVGSPDIWAATFLKSARENKEPVKPLLEQALIFAYSKGKPVRDPAAHATRESLLRAISESLTSIRQTYGMPTYAELRHQHQ